MKSIIPLAGLYTRLKDKDLQLEHKLQLLRFAWKSSQVVIPNKEQVLIDLLTGYLLNKKKYQLREDEVGKVWKCLYDVLKTKKSHRANKQGQGLVIKQSICQVILEALSSSVSTDLSCSYLDSLIGCCQTIISSTTLSYIFTGKLDQMLSLFGILCSLFVKHNNDDVTRESLKTLLDEAVTQYKKVQKTAPNQKQLLQWGCSKLLPNFFNLWSVAQTWDSLSGPSERLCDALEQTLFHRDHQEGYASYLNVKYRDLESTATKKPKLVEQVFTALNTAIQDKDIDLDSVSLYIPVVFESFIKADSHNSNLTTAHHMLMECCNLIGVKSDSTIISGHVSKAVVIKALNQLLRVVQRWDLYSASADEKGKQLQFYRHLISVLLENRCYGPDWYSCFTVLLQLYHQILEPSLSDILLNIWLNIDKKPEDISTTALDEFLQETVTTYQKLRQFQKFMVKLLETLKRSSNTHYIVTPTGFLKRFGEVTQSLPQGMTVDIWKTFIQHMRDTHVLGEFTGHFQGICTLFYEYLLNVKVADYSTTDITLKAVQDLMVTMETEILVPLLQRCRKNKEVPSTTLVSTLQLCFVWGEMAIMLAQHIRFRADNFSSQPQVHTSSDLSYVHSYMSSKEWNRIHKKIYRSEDKMLIYSWDKLIFQQTRAQLFFSESKIISMPIELDLPLEISYEDLRTIWYPSVYSINNDNYMVAKWHLLVSSMAAIYSVMTVEQCSEVACFIVQTVDRVENSSSDMVSLSRTTDMLLNSSWIKEFATLQSCIITAAWDNVGLSFDSKLKSGKKRRLETTLAAMKSVMSLLGDENVSWQDGLTSETAEALQKVAAVVNSLLGNQDRHDEEPGLDKIQNSLEILQKLPLECLSSYDQLRCLFGLLSLTAFIINCPLSGKGRTSLEIETQNEAKQLQDEVSNQTVAVFTKCMQLLMVLLECSGPASVFQLLDLSVCLNWLQKIQSLPISKKNISTYLRVLVFVQMSCSSMVKDYQVLEKMPAVVTQLCLYLKDHTSTKNESALFLLSVLLQDISKNLNKPYFNESLRTVCSEMFVSMARAVLDYINILSTQRYIPSSCHVVRSLSIIMATKQAAEVKGDQMAELVTALNDILEWCLESLEKDIEDHTRLVALNCLSVMSKHHNELGVAFTPEIKLEIWNKLVKFLQSLLTRQQPDTLLQTPGRKHSAVNILHAEESNHEGGPEIDTSKAETNTTCWQVGEDSSGTDKRDQISVDNVLKFLDHNEGKSLDVLDLSHPFNGSKVQMPKQILHTSCTSGTNSEIVLSFSAINSMYRSHVYEGNWERQSSEVILVQIQSVIATIVMSFDIEDFIKVIQGIVEDVSTKTMLCDVKKLQCSLYLWQQLLKLDLSPEQGQVVVDAAQNLMLNFQSIVQQLSHHGDNSVLMMVAIPVIRAQEQMLALGKFFLPPQMSVLCLHSCHFLPLGGSTYFAAFHAACNVLNTLLINHTETVLSTIPSFLGCAKMSVVQHSNQDKVQGDKDVIENLMDCAHQMERLFSQISTHKVEFSKVALYVVADYVTAVQRVTLVPAVKRALVPAVYKMLDRCDKHSIAQLHTVLSHGVCEVFKILYSDYNKYYRYTGKI